MYASLRALLARLALASSVAAVACSAATATPSGDDAQQPDEADAGRADADAPEPSGDAGDAGDAGAAGDGILGTLSGSCGVLRARLADPAAALDHDLLVFQAGEVYAKTSLSPDGQRLFDTPNAGGSSTESEAMSMEVLRACEGAKLLKTETEILYAPPDDAGGNAITDILVEIDGKKVGVSVTRAYKPKTQTFSDVEIAALLAKKLDGINHSSTRVRAADKWVRQILHVFAVDKAAADGVERVWKTLSSALRADTLILVTQTQGGGFIYCNPDPPLGSECN
jgi:hypothetical protein